MLNDKGQEIFPYQHAWLTADEIDERNEIRWAKQNRPVEFTPSYGMSEIESFQANLWALTLTEIS